MQARSASLDVIVGSYKLVLARIMPLRYRIGLYKSYVNSLNDTAWDMYGGRVAETLWFSSGNARLFKNSEHQLRAVLKWMPRFEKYRGILREHISIQRKQYGLKG